MKIKATDFKKNKLNKKIEEFRFLFYEKCPLCQSEFIKLYEKETYNHIYLLLRCLNCGHQQRSSLSKYSTKELFV